MELKGARVLLTGATGGLGRELARQLAASGANLLLVGRDGARLDEMVSGMRSTGVHVERIAADINDPDDLARIAQEAGEFRANVLVNNAGINAFGLFATQDWEACANVLTTNLLSSMRLTQALLPGLTAQPDAAILNIGSTFGSLPFPGFAAYSVAKAGLRAFSQALRRELADTRVAVIHVAPRAIDTPLNSPAVNALNRELGSRSDTPERAARQILAALRSGRAETHLGFPERLFAWLNGLVPGLIDHALAGKLACVKRHVLPTQ